MLVGVGPWFAGANNLSLVVKTDESKGKGTETYVPSSEVGITISSTEQGHSPLGRFPKASGTRGR